MSPPNPESVTASPRPPTGGAAAGGGREAEEQVRGAAGPGVTSTD